MRRRHSRQGNRPCRLATRNPQIRRLHCELLEDRRLESVDLEIVCPGDPCRVGYVFDILEPRAKEEQTNLRTWAN
ncbi:MAG: hypothetical protein IH898_04265 [Planctomycetes bacterium]|nr:hypothetical protein [Planctomycetota bacterium]